MSVVVSMRSDGDDFPAHQAGERAEPCGLMAASGGGVVHRSGLDPAAVAIVVGGVGKAEKTGDGSGVRQRFLQDFAFHGDQAESAFADGCEACHRGRAGRDRIGEGRAAPVDAAEIRIA